MPPDGRRSDTAALYALTLDAQGRVLRGSPTLSACGWAVGRLRPGRLPDLDGFDEEQRGFAAALGRLGARGRQPENGTPDARSMLAGAAGRHLRDSARAAVGAGATAAGVAVTAATAAAVFPVAGPVVGGIAGAVAGGFAEKLLTPPGATSPQPAQHVARGDIGEGLDDYLACQVGTSDRVEVRTRRDLVLDAVGPLGIPAGRWPDDADKPLAMGQQFAVNKILGQLRPIGGITSVNGPPGTGKSTLLRDVMAAVVVDRAEVLADLGTPEDAFGEVLETVLLGEKRRPAKVRRITPELTGFEMVVTTAGNRAAANITAEVPGVGAVGRQADAARAIDYFVDVAERMTGRPAWGLMAATLGNSELTGVFGTSPGSSRSPA